MDTKEKARAKRPAKRGAEEKPPRQKSRTAVSAKRSPVQADNDEVYIPKEETREERNRPERLSSENPRPRRAPSGKTSGKSKASAADHRYQPYRRRNAMEKRRRSKDFQQSVRKFFSAENPVVRLFYKEDPAVFGRDEPVDPNEQRKKRRAAENEKRRKRAQRWNMPTTMYIEPAAFNSRRLAVQLMTVLAVVLALVLGMSVFFKVEVVMVSGSNVYSAEEVRAASGISNGDNLLTFGRTKACGQIIANLPYVRSARIGIKLPNTVNIEIEEAPVVYTIQDQDSVWWLINSDGKVVEQISSMESKDHTMVLGVTLYEPHAGEEGVAKEDAPVETQADGTVVPVMVTAAQRLNAAMKILQALEANDIVGDAASINVSQLQDIILWYGERYQVNLGNIDQINYKIAYMKSAIMQMSDYQTGVLDVSFTTWPDSAGFTPFG